ncbi:MAG: YkgJ family cysteine cluster protein [Sulfurimonadaceae bacterium]|jgi:Fe-S-cluster containining protein|nr:YkgJ family cysteine cluster protein [Sulfurimonadaceae bacterium]
MHTLIKKEGYPYGFDASACATCQGRCCTGESGNIFVNKEEIEAIIKLLDCSIDQFFAQYLKKVGYRYSIKERLIGESYECMFYDKASNGCTIYQARPLQCRTFPFWEYFKTHIDELKNECPGIVDV